MNQAWIFTLSLLLVIIGSCKSYEIFHFRSRISRITRSKGLEIPLQRLFVPYIRPMPPTLQILHQSSNDYPIISRIQKFLGRVRSSIASLRSLDWEILRAEVSYRWISFTNNMREAEVSLRGDRSLLSSFIFSSFIFFGVPTIVSFLIQCVGLVSLALGYYLLIDGTWSLGPNISLLLAPTRNHELVTASSFDIVRHPMYGGLGLLCLGTSLLYKDIDKLFLTSLLFFALVRCLL